MCVCVQISLSLSQPLPGHNEISLARQGADSGYLLGWIQSNPSKVQWFFFICSHMDSIYFIKLNHKCTLYVCFYMFLWIKYGLSRLSFKNVHVLVISCYFLHFPTPTRGKKSESQLRQVDEQDLGASDAVNPRAAESQVLRLCKEITLVKVDCINLCI